MTDEFRVLDILMNDEWCIGDLMDVWLYRIPEIKLCIYKIQQNSVQLSPKFPMIRNVMLDEHPFLNTYTTKQFDEMRPKFVNRLKDMLINTQTLIKTILKSVFMRYYYIRTTELLDTMDNVKLCMKNLNDTKLELDNLRTINSENLIKFNKLRKQMNYILKDNFIEYKGQINYYQHINMDKYLDCHYNICYVAYDNQIVLEKIKLIQYKIESFETKLKKEQQYYVEKYLRFVDAQNLYAFLKLRIPEIMNESIDVKITEV